MRLGVAVLAMALLPGGAPAPRVEHFPLSAGNRWTLRDLESGRLRTVRVESQSRGLVLRGFPGVRELRVRAAGTAVQAWDTRDRRWETFLRLGAAAGTRYVVDLRVAPFWESLEVRVASRRALVHGAGDRPYPGCVSLTFRSRKPIADAGLIELAFAPRVGLVRISEQSIAGPRTSVLESFVGK